MKPDRINEYKNGINFVKSVNEQMCHDINQNRQKAFGAIANKKRGKKK